MSSAEACALKVSHVILRVSDMERSVAFYRDLVGLPLRFTSEEFSGFDAGGLTLMLNQLAADFRDPDGHVLSITGWVPHESA